MRYVGANPHPKLAAADRLPGVVNYFLGNDPTKWHTNIPTSQGVTYTGVYRGIDLAWHGAGQDLEYDFVVAPGADPNQIALSFDGAKALALAANGDLLVTMANGTVVRHKAPALYQHTAHGRTAVPGAYRIAGTTVGFAVGSYDPTRTLTIDPIIYSTFLVGPTTTASAISGVDVDAAGNAYVTGTANAPTSGTTPRSTGNDFPSTPGPTRPRRRAWARG